MNRHQFIEKSMLHNANKTQQIITASTIEKSWSTAQSKPELKTNELSNRRFWRTADDHYHKNFYREH